MAVSFNGSLPLSNGSLPLNCTAAGVAADTSPDSSQSVSAGSAFFIAIALLFGAMTQVPGSLVTGEANRFWRISPFLCIAETLIIFLRLIQPLWRDVCTLFRRYLVPERAAWHLDRGERHGPSGLRVAAYALLAERLGNSRRYNYWLRQQWVEAAPDLDDLVGLLDEVARLERGATLRPIVIVPMVLQFLKLLFIRGDFIGVKFLPLVYFLSWFSVEFLLLMVHGEKLNERDMLAAESILVLSTAPTDIASSKKSKGLGTRVVTTVVTTATTAATAATATTSNPQAETRDAQQAQIAGQPSSSPAAPPASSPLDAQESPKAAVAESLTLANPSTPNSSIPDPSPPNPSTPGLSMPNPSTPDPSAPSSSTSNPSSSTADLDLESQTRRAHVRAQTKALLANIVGEANVPNNRVWFRGRRRKLSTMEGNGSNTFYQNLAGVIAQFFESWYGAILVLGFMADYIPMWVYVVTIILVAFMFPVIILDGLAGTLVSSARQLITGQSQNALSGSRDWIAFKSAVLILWYYAWEYSDLNTGKPAWLDWLG